MSCWLGSLRYISFNRLQVFRSRLNFWPLKVLFYTCVRVITCIIRTLSCFILEFSPLFVSFQYWIWNLQTKLWPGGCPHVVGPWWWDTWSGTHMKKKKRKEKCALWWPSNHLTKTITLNWTPALLCFRVPLQSHEVQQLLYSRWGE